MMNTVTILLSALSDIFAAPAVFLLSYNAVAPKMFGFGRLEYWDAFIFVMGARSIWGQPVTVHALQMLEVNRIIEATRPERPPV